MALAKHWLDDVIGDNLTADAIAKAITTSPAFLHIVKFAADQAALDSDTPTKPGQMGRIVPPQSIRVAIVNGFKNAEGQPDASDAD